MMLCVYMICNFQFQQYGCTFSLTKVSNGMGLRGDLIQICLLEISKSLCLTLNPPSFFSFLSLGSPFLLIVSLSSQTSDLKSQSLQSLSCMWAYKYSHMMLLILPSQLLACISLFLIPLPLNIYFSQCLKSLEYDLPFCGVLQKPIPNGCTR